MPKNNFFIIKNNHTPMIKQYFSIKEKYPNMLLFYQMGDFYELFYEDAKRVSQLLKISLTKKGYSNKNIIPMAGVPCHTADYYLAKLIKMGESIAVCDQVKDIHSEKKLISRQVVRVITPGTVTDEAFLEDNKDNFIAAIWKEDSKFAYSILDISLGFFGVSEHFNENSLLAEIERTNPTELLYPECFENISLISHRKCIQKRPLLDFDLKISYNLLKLQFNTASLDGFGIKKNHFVIRPAGCLLNYVKLMHMKFLPHIRKIKFNYVNNNIFMNASTRKSLEITQSISGDSKNTVSSILNKTITSMGWRLLNRWLNSPSKDLKLIRNRQKMVKDLQPFYKEIQHILSEISDLERISSRLALRTALPRDFVRMRSTLNILPNLGMILKKINSKNINNIRISIGTFKKIFLLLKKSINLTVPSSIRDGGVIASNYSKKLDVLRGLKENSKKYLKDLEIQEKNKLNIDSLKIKFNKIIGYYIQVSKRHSHLIPQFYFKVQTLKRVERYSTPLLKNYEKKAINAASQALILEKKLYLELFDIIEPYLEKLKSSALALSQLDVLVSLSERAISLNYVCPEIKKKYGICLLNSRHPVVECFLETPFISNSVSLSKKTRMIIITGPNMGGKSTYMRQIAIIVIMACIGSFVPAEYASIGLIDHIFTRVGSADDLSNGYSTFMMEMTEISNILNNANCNSLVLIDELGRGTSHKDGLALSWSCCKHLILKNQSMVLLSTHFFELTELENLFKYVKNFYFSAIEHDSNIVFLYKIKEGISRKSYGISVAALSGIPDSVIKDAKLKLIELEKK